jgi:hypothetical protein
MAIVVLQSRVIPQLAANESRTRGSLASSLPFYVELHPKWVDGLGEPSLSSGCLPSHATRRRTLRWNSTAATVGPRPGEADTRLSHASPDGETTPVSRSASREWREQENESRPHGGDEDEGE